ncbi:MAG: hypothetical protein ACRD9L_05530 [Bryobacteraceae bacterium]
MNLKTVLQSALLAVLTLGAGAPAFAQQPPAATPEPGTVGTMAIGVGIGAYIWYRGRKRK